MRNSEPKKIGALHLRLPGTSPVEGARIGRRVADLLARELPSTEARRIGALRVKVSADASTTEAELADRIARAIRGGVR